MNAEITIGPVLYHWSADEKLDFYRRIADEAPADTVYVGEVICSKRSVYFDSHLPEVIERLERAGKRVILSTLAEVVLKRERDMIRVLTEDGEREVEINNAAGLASIGGRRHRIGQMMNVYNEETLGWLAGKGATHFTLPSEVPGTVAAMLAKAAYHAGSTVEVQVFGRASLAVSARCYHARAHNRSKDNCQFVCETDPDGMPLKTVTGQPFLAVNGIQTQSHSYINLAAEIPDMIEMGVNALRLSPQKADMVAVAQIFSDRVAGCISGGETLERLSELDLQAPFSNGFWHGQIGSRAFGPLAA